MAMGRRYGNAKDGGADGSNDAASSATNRFNIISRAVLGVLA
jgi:hypothetical protein